MAKTVSRKASKTAAPSELRIKFTKADQARAEQCLERTGKITLSMKSVSVTKLGGRIVRTNFFTD